MIQRRSWPAAVLAAVLLAGCGSAGNPSESATGTAAAGDDASLVVWDWKSGDDSAANYVREAKADFARKHPGVEVEFVNQPFEQYYNLLGAAIQAGKGPDVVLFNGGGQIRDRADSLVALDEAVADDRERLKGWEAFSEDGKTYASPVTLQGHPIYYNKELYRKAGLDPDKPPTTWDALLSNCAAIKKSTGAACFALGNKEGIGIQFFMSALASGILTPAEQDAWIAGQRDWNSPGVKKIFQLWKDAEEAGLNTKGANSTALFNDAFGSFEAAKAAHMIGLMSDIGHWKDFGSFLGDENVGVMLAPTVTAGTEPSLPYDGGIGYGVTKWTKDPALAADLVRSLTATSALRAFSADAGAIVSDPDASAAGSPAAGTIAEDLTAGKPALHVALSSKTQELMGRLSQQLLSGSVSVDDALKQLAASDASG